MSIKLEASNSLTGFSPLINLEPSALKTYYNQAQQLTPKQKANNMMSYLESTGIPFDFSDRGVQAALLKGIMGDVTTDERGNIVDATKAAVNNRKKTK